MTTDRTWKGSVIFSEHVFAYAGALQETALHAHHAVQLILALDGVPVVLQDGQGSPERSLGFVVPANVPHAIRSSSARALLVYVDPQSDHGMALGSAFSGVETTRAGAWRVAGSGLATGSSDSPIDVGQLVEVVLEPFARRGRPREFHPRVQAALDVLPGLAGQGEVRLNRLAKSIGISESRLLHLFKEQVGVPFRSYVRWLRLRIASDAVRAGANLTEAAHAAGFTDSAHLSNVFRETFGVAPSEVARGVGWLE